jgi:protein TonB
MTAGRVGRVARYVLHRLAVVGGAFVITALLFLVLPLMQAIARSSDTDTIVRSVDAAYVPPPPPPPEEEKKEEEKPEEEKPELSEEAPPLDLSQLALALNPGAGDGWMTADFAPKIDGMAGSAKEVDELFSLSDLDQKPRLIYKVNPVVNAKMRKKIPGTVKLIFVVDQRGKVESPRVQSSTDPVFDAAALNAVRQWKFEPGKRSGKPVRFRLKVPMVFPEGL